MIGPGSFTLDRYMLKETYPTYTTRESLVKSLKVNTIFYRAFSFDVIAAMLEG